MKQKLIILAVAVAALFSKNLLPKVAVSFGALIISHDFFGQDNSHTHKAHFYNDRYIYIDTAMSLMTELPPLEWSAIQSKPGFKGVAFSGSYNDLDYTPDLNHLPNYYEKGTVDTMLLKRMDTVSKVMTDHRAGIAISAMEDMIDTKASLSDLTWTNISGKPSIPAAQVNSDWNASSGVGVVLNKPDMSLYATNSGLSATLSGYVTSGGLSTTLGGYATNSSVTSGLSAKQNNITLTTTGTGSATFIGGTLNIPTPAGVTYSGGTGINVTGYTITNTSPDQTVVLTAGRGVSITGTYPNFTISLVTPTIDIRTGGTARALNTNFTPNSTKEVIATYTVTCSVTNPLLVGTSSATAFLEYSTNAGSTWQLPSQVGNSSGVGVTVTLQLTNGQTGTLVGVIPANALARIRTVTAGTASVTYVTGQEVSY